MSTATSVFDRPYYTLAMLVAFRGVKQERELGGPLVHHCGSDIP